MKALSLWQPWASLVAVGAKRIETRSWSTSYRGPLAIHAAKVPPDVALRPLSIDGWELEYHSTAWYVKRPGTGIAHHLPLGAIVATCVVEACVPIVGVNAVINNPQPTRPPFIVDTSALGGALCLATVDNMPAAEDIEDERPYGDFTPGRYAWMLGDVRPVDPPVLARGRQRLWEWTP